MSPRLIVIEAGEKAKLVAVMVTAALGGTVVEVVATVVAVVVTVVVGTCVVVVVGGCVVVVGGCVVVVGGCVVVVGGMVVVACVLVIAAVVVGTVVVKGDAIVDVRAGTVVFVNDPSNESSVTALAQAVNIAKTSNSVRRIAGHTYEG